MALYKVSFLAKIIHFSGTLREALKAACDTKGCKVKIIRRPVRTRWNSTTMMIGDALDVRPALHAISNSPKYKLGRWALSDTEWQVLKDLYAVLEAGSLSPPLIHYLPKPPSSLSSVQHFTWKQWPGRWFTW